jgi:DNA-binding NarL/FixJ family response regulator
MKIIIVDDHPLFANSLAMMISAMSDFEITHTFKNGLEFINFLKENNSESLPNIILLDINMPILNGIETMSWIKKNMPKLDVIALSVNDDEKVVLKMVKLGVKGYLLKDCEPETFIEALNIVYKKGFFYSDKISKYIFESILKPKKNLFNDKELDFIKYSCSELTYKEIADKMYCSPRTVEGYRDSLFEKLDLKTRVGLAVYAIKNNLD